MTIRVVVADDHRMLRDALQKILDGKPDIEVVGTAENGRDAVMLVRELKPDVVVLDISMPELNGIESAARIRARDVDVNVVGISSYIVKHFVEEMLAAGACGFVTKASAADELVEAIRAAAGARRYLCSRASAELADAVRPATRRNGATKPTLSHREREVLQLVAEGLRTTEIAARMHVANATVEVHRRNITRKLGLRSVAELTRYAIRQGLTPL